MTDSSVMSRCCIQVELNFPPQAAVKNVLGAAHQGERIYCPYCLKHRKFDHPDGLEVKGSLVVHMKEHHADEKDVQDYFQTTGETCEDKLVNRAKRRWLLSRIKNKGHYLHNLILLEFKRLNPKCGADDYEFVDFVVCSICLKILKNVTYVNHFERCAFNPDDNGFKSLLNSTSLVENAPEVSEAFKQNILDNIISGKDKWKKNVASVAQNDPLIVLFGSVIYSSMRSDMTVQYSVPSTINLCMRMQDLSEILILVKKINGHLKVFEECFHPKSVKDLVNAAVKIFNFYQCKGEEYALRFAARLQSSLEFCVHILKTQFETFHSLSQREKNVMFKVLDDFFEKFHKEWTCELGDVYKYKHEIEAEEIEFTNNRQSTLNLFPKDGSRGYPELLGVNCCPYCISFHKSLVKHLKEHHAAEEDVEEYLQAKDDDKFVMRSKQKFLLQEIKNKGSYHYNLRLLAREQLMKTAANIRSCVADYNNSGYTICKLCLKVLKVSYYYQHFMWCVFATDVENGDGFEMEGSAFHLMLYQPMVSEAFIKMSGERGKENVYSIIKSDPLLLNVGWTFYSVCNFSDTDLRLQDLSKVFMLMNDIHGDLKAFEDCFSPQFVDAMVYAVSLLHQVCPHKTFKPDIVPRIGSSLDCCVHMLKTEIEQHNTLSELEKTSLLTDLNNFVEQLSKKWQCEFSCNFDYNKSLIRGKVSSQFENQSAFESDVIEAFSFLANECESLVKNLEEKPWENLETYTNLSKRCIALMFIFNKELLIDEVTSTLLQDYLECKKSYDQLQSGLSGQSEPEDSLYQLNCIKRGNELIPCFLNRLMKKSIDVLVSTRNTLKISSLYLFPKTNLSKEMKCERYEGHLIINELQIFLNSRSTNPRWFLFNARNLRKHTVEREKLVEVSEAIEKERKSNEETRFDESKETEITAEAVNNSVSQQLIGTVTESTVSDENCSEAGESDEAASSEDDTFQQPLFPKTIITRKRWTYEEQTVIATHFGKYILLSENPGRHKIEEIFLNEPLLRDRTLDQVCSYVHNITSGKSHLFPEVMRELKVRYYY